jgi:hypothetical protein
VEHQIGRVLAATVVGEHDLLAAWAERNGWEELVTSGIVVDPRRCTPRLAAIG